MHGRPRRPSKPEDAASVARAEKLRTLQSQFFHFHHNNIFTKEALEVSAKLLEMNPDIHTAWNYRKIAINRILESKTDVESIKQILDEELRMVEKALMQNIKAYGAWYHRKWVVSKGFSSLDHEFKLLDKLLKFDARNFHGWNYRRFVATLKDVSNEKELEYMKGHIDVNFSNYSAWHNRSVLLSNLFKRHPEYIQKQAILTEEYDLVRQAIFVDPDDQSGWFYHLWLLNQTKPSSTTGLLATWPESGMDLTLTLDTERDLLISTGGQNYSLINRQGRGRFPVILHFNKFVGGVHSSCIDVESALVKSEELVWSPLESKSSKMAKSWITYLPISSDEFKGSKGYNVKVSLGHTPGIFSSDGSDYRYVTQFDFILNLQYSDVVHVGESLDRKMVVWNSDDSGDTTETINECVSYSPSLCLHGAEDIEGSLHQWQLNTLDNEIRLFRELLSYYPSRFGKLTLARLLMAHDAAAGDVDKGVSLEEALELFRDLIQTDPSHARYYKDQYSMLLLKQIMVDKKKLTKHCKQPRSSNDFVHPQPICIEVLQFLECLSISNNKFRSFTSLEPLRFLPSFRVLDVSHNEIGAHSTDSTRYLCSSSLSNGSNMIRKDKQHGDRDQDEELCWEAQMIFGELSLFQLDIRGNPGLNENIGLLIATIIPSLHWLNGEYLH